MTVRSWFSPPILFAVLLGLGLTTASAQPAGRGAPGADRGPDRRGAERAERPGTHGPEKGRRGPPSWAGGPNGGRDGRLHVPKGHRPPPGQCRLWYPGRPPGQQPPPVSCRRAERLWRGRAVIVTHRGPVRRRPAPRWRSRPAEDIVYRRPRKTGVRISVEVIVDLLGRDRVRRLRERRRRLGLRGRLTGRWSSTRGGGLVLRIQAGDRPLARLVDRRGDGRADRMDVRRPRPSRD